MKIDQVIKYLRIAFAFVFGAGLMSYAAYGWHIEWIDDWQAIIVGFIGFVFMYEPNKLQSIVGSSLSKLFDATIGRFFGNGGGGKAAVIIFMLASSTAFGQLEIPYSIKVLNPKPVDFYYCAPDGTPYANVAAALSSVTTTRYRGQMVNVNGAIYYFKNGIADVDLVPLIEEGGGGSEGVNGIGTLNGATKSANGAAITGTNLFLQTADATFPGLVSAGAQDIAGQKSFLENMLLTKNQNAITSFKVLNTNTVNQSSRALLSVQSGTAIGELLSIGTGAPGIYFGSSSNHDVNFTHNGSTKLTLTGTGLGIGTTSPNAPLQFSTAFGNRKIVLFESVNNDHQVFAFGMNDDGSRYTRYQIPDTGSSHRFYAGTSSTTSNELLRLTGTGVLKFPTGSNNRKISLFESADNDHQYYGFGIGASILQYKVSSTTANHVWYAGTSPTTSQELMRLTGAGSLGIGTAAPEAALHINNPGADGVIARFSGGASGYSTSLGHDATGSHFYTNSASRGFTWGSNGSTTQMVLTASGELGIGSSTVTNYGGGYRNVEIRGQSATSGGALWVTSSDRTRMGSLAMTSGSLVLGTQTNHGVTIAVNSANLFTFSGAGVGTATDWVATSDRRLKYNIVPVGSQLEKINSIAKLVRNYDRKDNGQNETGFIAQELLPVAPEFVNVPEDPGEMMGVNYAKMVVPLYKAIEELTAELERLKKEVEQCKSAHPSSIQLFTIPNQDNK